MRNVIAFPLLGLAVLIQSSIVSQVALLSGYADIILILLAAWALQERVTSAWQWAFLFRRRSGVPPDTTGETPVFLSAADSGAVDGSGPRVVGQGTPE